MYPGDIADTGKMECKNITIPGDIIKGEPSNIQAYKFAVFKTYSIGQSAIDFRISGVSSQERFFT